MRLGERDCQHHRADVVGASDPLTAPLRGEVDGPSDTAPAALSVENRRSAFVEACDPSNSRGPKLLRYTKKTERYQHLVAADLLKYEKARENPLRCRSSPREASETSHLTV